MPTFSHFDNNIRVFINPYLTIFDVLLAGGAPPFSSTIFIASEIITPKDPTIFRSINFAG
jgi:hypothetical protein